MSWSTIVSANIAAGKPVTADLWTKVKDNDDDHETRLTTVETAVSSIPPIVFGVIGRYWREVSDGILSDVVPFDVSVLGCYLFVVDDGSSGTLTCDLEYKRGAGAWTTIFSTLPSIASGGGDYQVSTNQVISTDIQTNGLSDGDFLRLNIDSAQYENDEFYLILEIERA